MGRKGVSKRKSSQSKNGVVTNKSTKGAVSGLSKTSKLPVVMPLVRDEAVSASKDGKKKSSGLKQNDKKR